MMKPIAARLLTIVDEFAILFQQIEQTIFDEKLNPEKWSKKEIVGHLIDSAQNNLRRFIVGQYQTHDKIIYQQDFWVAANNYQKMSQASIIDLWQLLNHRIVAVLEEMPSGYYTNVIDTGKENINTHTLLWLAEDYIQHLQHHINQIIPGSFDVNY